MGQFRLLSFSTEVTTKEDFNFYLDLEETKKLLLQLKNWPTIKEALVLSVPERTEILYYSSEVLDDAIYSAIVAIKAKDNFPAANLFQHSCNEERSLTHLSELCFGVQSSTYGSVPLFPHFVAAFSTASQCGMAGELLEQWWNHLVSTNNAIKNEVSFQFPNFSISYTVTDMVTELIRKVKTPKIAIVGFNALGKRVYQNLTQKGFNKITIVESSITSFSTLQGEELKNFIFEPFDQTKNVLQENDIVISTLEDLEPVFSQELETPDLSSPKVLIDLSLKGDFLAWLNHHELVISFELADIYQIIENKMDINKRWLKKAKPLIAQRNAVFFGWMDKKKGMNMLDQANDLLNKHSFGDQYFTKVMNNDNLKVKKSLTSSLMNKQLLKKSIEKIRSASPYKDMINYERMVNDFYLYN